jgi:hypothetical protein
MDESSAVKHKILLSRVKSRKMKQLRNNPYGTSMNGYTKNAPLPLDEDDLTKRMRTLQDRKTIDQHRRKKNQKIKKKPLPVEQVEEFLGMKPLDPTQRRTWNLDEAEFLRFQSAARHSANNVRQKTSPSSPIRLTQLRSENNNDFYKRYMQNMPNRAPRFMGRYETVTEPKRRPAPVWVGPRKQGPRSQERYVNEPITGPKTRPKPMRSGTQKNKKRITSLESV